MDGQAWGYVVSVYVSGVQSPSAHATVVQVPKPASRQVGVASGKESNSSDSTPFHQWHTQACLKPPRNKTEMES